MSQYNRKLFLSLVIIAILLWTYNGMLLFEGFGITKRKIDVVENRSQRIVQPLKFNADFSDPFYCKAFMGSVIKPGKKVTSSKTRKIKIVKKAVKLPKCKISGIVFSAQKPAAMLEYKGNNVIVKEGDLLDSMRIKKIYTDSIKIIYKGTVFYLKR